MLGTGKARANSPAFALGWIAGLVAVSLIALVVASGADDPDSDTSTTVDIVKLALGALFLLLAIKQWRARPKPGEQAELRKWMSTIDAFTPGKSLVLGAKMLSTGIAGSATDLRSPVARGVAR